MSLLILNGVRRQGLQINADYITKIEANWDDMHYQAKEWLLMLYELCYAICPEVRDKLDSILLLHSHDDDFNVALYAKILHDTLYSSNEKEFVIAEKEYFNRIPEYGIKRFIKTKKFSPWINGYTCVLEQIELLEKRLEEKLDDLEYRTAEYEGLMDPIPDLIPLNRFQRGGCRVSCENVNRSFYRVLYKDWYEGRWQGCEIDLARCVLSASEPYYTIVSPQKWRWNKDKLFDGIEDILQKSDEEIRSQIENVFSIGIGSDEIILAGSVVDYTYKQELIGYILSFIDSPFYGSKHAACRFERNSRLLLLQRDDFYEDKHLNISLHHNGIESFKHSNIMCGISKFALRTFGWSIEIESEGAILLNSNRNVIGRLEYYYAARTDMGIRYSGNQPLLQRWVAKKDEVKKALDDAQCPFIMKNVVDYYVCNSNELD